MKIEFDLQQFAEGDENVEETNDYADEMVEEAEGETETSEASKDEVDKEPIPEELQGLDEPYARAAMKEWKEKLKQSKPEQEVQPQPAPTPEPDAKDKEIAQLKAQIAAMQQPQVPLQPQQPQVPLQQQQPPQLRLTPENVKLLENAVHQEALKISGFTQQDLDSFEFADEGDARVSMWKYAQQMARDRVINAIQQEQQRITQTRAQLQQQAQDTARDFQEFYAKESADKNFQMINNFAIQELPKFKDFVSDRDFSAIVQSAKRIDKGVAEPTDVALVKMYYKVAKMAVLSKPKSQAQPQAQAQSARNKAAKLPKADMLQGSADPVGGSISNAELERLIETGQTKKIPKNILDYMNNANIFK